MLRICKDRKRSYVSLGISVNQIHWDFTKNIPKLTCPNREQIELISSKTLSEYQHKVLELEALGIDFTPQMLIEAITKPKAQRRGSISDVFREQIDQLKKDGRRGYMKSVQQVFNSLLKYTDNKLDIPFSVITLAWLKKYEAWLRNQDLKDNTIGIRMRTLRMIYNSAIEKGIVSDEDYPFKSYKVSKLSKTTLKRALKKKDIKRVMAYKANNKYQQFALDVFAFSYYTGGINFVDIANLKRGNIIEGRIVYTRQKTHAPICIPIQQPAWQLIKKYETPDSLYLFPILSNFHRTEIQKENRVHKVITKINKRLKEIGQELGIELKITTYVARHTQATVMKRAGVSVSVISDIMGHSSEKVTQYYLDSFGNEQFDKAMGKL